MAQGKNRREPAAGSRRHGNCNGGLSRVSRMDWARAQALEKVVAKEAKLAVLARQKAKKAQWDRATVRLFHTTVASPGGIELPFFRLTWDEKVQVIMKALGWDTRPSWA